VDGGEVTRADTGAGVPDPAGGVPCESPALLNQVKVTFLHHKGNFKIFMPQWAIHSPEHNICAPFPRYN
jgi:hypothetical protein